MKDFIHGALVKAASSDGIETMLKGAGIGAGANVGIGAVQGDFDVIGNAFSGAALGGIGGAGMKFGANRYAGNLLKQADGIAEAGSKKVGMFTNPGENHSLSFMGGDANTERFAKMAAAGEFNGKGYSAGAAAKAAEVGSNEIKDTATTPTPKAMKKGDIRRNRQQPVTTNELGFVNGLDNGTSINPNMTTKVGYSVPTDYNIHGRPTSNLQTINPGANQVGVGSSDLFAAGPTKSIVANVNTNTPVNIKNNPRQINSAGTGHKYGNLK